MRSLFNHLLLFWLFFKLLYTGFYIIFIMQIYQAILSIIRRRISWALLYELTYCWISIIESFCDRERLRSISSNDSGLIKLINHLTPCSTGVRNQRLWVQLLYFSISEVFSHYIYHLEKLIFAYYFLIVYAIYFLCSYFFQFFPGWSHIIFH